MTRAGGVPARIEVARARQFQVGAGGVEVWVAVQLPVLLEAVHHGQPVGRPVRHGHRDGRRSYGSAVPFLLEDGDQLIDSHVGNLPAGAS